MNVYKITLFNTKLCELQILQHLPHLVVALFKADFIVVVMEIKCWKLLEFIVLSC